MLLRRGDEPIYNKCHLLPTQIMLKSVSKYLFVAKFKNDLHKSYTTFT